jgi:hypothetical protein
LPSGTSRHAGPHDVVERPDWRFDLGGVEVT